MYNHKENMNPSDPDDVTIMDNARELDVRTVLPPPEPAPAPPPPSPEKPKSRKKLFIIAGSVLALIILVVVVVLLATGNRQSGKRALDGGDPFLNAVTHAPRYSSITSVAEIGNSKWYVTNGGVVRISGGKASFYATAQGIPAGLPQNLAVHNGRLWLATQNGVAYLDPSGSRFLQSQIDGSKSSFENVRLLYDSIGKRMYLTTFEGFYSYDDRSEAWTKIDGPKNIMSFASGTGYTAMYASQDGWPIWVSDKNTRRWQRLSPPIEEQSGTIAVIDNEVFVFGRPKGYANCDSAGKITATSAFRLVKGEKEMPAWQPAASFNADIRRPELNLLANPAGGIQAKTSPCDPATKVKIYDVNFDGTNLYLQNEQDASASQVASNMSVQQQAQYIKEISDATGLHPSMHILDVDGAGNVIFSYGDVYTDSSGPDVTYIAVARQADLRSATTIDSSTLQGKAKYPIMCGTGKDRRLAYMFSAEHQLEQDKFGNGLWSNVKLYSVDGSKLKFEADLNDDVSVPVFACSDKQIVWLGKTSVQRFDRSTKKLTRIGNDVGTDLRYNNTSADSTQKGNLWYSVNSDSPSASSLYYYDAEKNRASKVTDSIDVRGLRAATDTHVAVYSNQNKETRQALYNSSGEIVQKLDSTGPIIFANPKKSYLMVTDEQGPGAFVPFNISKFELSGIPLRLPGFQAGFGLRRDMLDIGTYGLGGRPILIYDEKRNLVWVNEDTFGFNSLPVK